MLSKVCALKGVDHLLPKTDFRTRIHWVPKKGPVTIVGSYPM